jgi:hypothetical protein
VTDATDLAVALPTVVRVTQSFATRMPTQRVIDEVNRIEGGSHFAELMTEQTFRVVAFRALVRDHPNRDLTSLWLHSYDVEVEVVEDHPSNGASPTPGPPSGPTGTSTPTS